MRGSLTVEASFVVPFCIIVIFIICQLGIYQYDREVLKMTGYECILKTIETETLKDSDFCEVLQNRALEAARERVLGVKDLSVAAKTTNSKVSITFRGIETMLETPLEVSAVYETVYPELTLQLTRVVMGE